MRQTKLFLLIVSLTFIQHGFAQSAIEKMQAKISSQPAVQTAGVKLTIINPTQAGILFSADNRLPEDQSPGWLAAQLALRPDVDVLKADAMVVNTAGLLIKKQHQYYKGIKVEHGVINTTSVDGKIAMMQMEYYTIDNNFNTSPAINEQQALVKAKNFIGADQYAWDGYTGNDSNYMTPHGELVIIQTYKTPGEVCLAYKFDIYALQPLSRAYVYINAWDGSVVLNDPIIKHSGEDRETPPPPTTPDGKVIKGKTLDELKNEPAHTDNTFSEKQPALLNAGAPNNLSAYSNSIGIADTRFVGQQTILTDNNSGIEGLAYRLREYRNHQNIITLDYLNNAGNAQNNYDASAGDFLDNDNHWTAAEYNTTTDDAALDVQFNMQLVSDYWLNVQQRNGWDNRNSQIKSFVHVDEFLKATNGLYYKYKMRNAYWAAGTMHFGDGSGDLTKTQPYTTLDISAHEMGHAITETTCSLVYQWESGAMNEAFSDIWAACITNYAKLHVASLPGEVTWRIAEKCANLDKPDKGFRDMSNPPLFSNPSTYKNVFWKKATLPTCRSFDTTDNCGVHTNSGVLNKWFFLITDGENSVNSSGTIYNVTGLGFATSQKIAYVMELNLPPNATYATAKTVSINSTAILYGMSSPELKTVKDAWVAVGVDSNIYNMANTPVFTTNNFTSIAVGKNGDVWAGTNYSGIYRYDGTSWAKRDEIPDVRINDIKADKSGDIWVAQSGTNGSGSMAIAGGVNYFKSPYGAADAYFYTIGAQTNIPSRNARCIYVDTSRMEGSNPKVWVATLNYITSGNSTSGMLGQGAYASGRTFINVSGGLNIASQTAGVLTVGGKSSEIWTFAQANNGTNQILTYNASTNAFITAYDHNSVPELPSGFLARSIYFDARKRCWLALQTGDLVVYDERGNWHHITLPPTIVPSGTEPGYNAIAGDKYGDVYIGTSSGILFFDRGDGLPDKIGNLNNYKLYGKNNGLSSNQVNAIAFDTLRFKLMVATDSGIVFFEPLCVAPYCKEFKFTANPESSTMASGNWSDPSIWSSNQVPDSSTIVTITSAIAVDINAQCRSLTVIPPGSVTVKSGINLTIFEDPQPVDYGRQNRKANNKNSKAK